ncbi:penicillin acylase family protein [Streptantibioticus cattleyicolor]|uniref:Putative penicillin acylase n=1 Tax=Streptantibioticus cattleyicolor (strain ATCC 35852 / DSM 46488 / JCM 4925 / NBRC 14057 / NRRL 8057) TaxID=1003195 RepID=F8JMR6_STREN|nr:penicillin acylase family protein [Streptantibioticus cattleyicolor]AEW99298.1 putative penicillin acylase [Streptantibioticus cattleyicolor NRRL 8057 = DSM 46488]CCB71662.1 Penicilin amidase [Streptantibioticus cattleyicolor NRRL 8057 = DSM 46488]
MAATDEESAPARDGGTADGGSPGGRRRRRWRWLRITVLVVVVVLVAGACAGALYVRWTVGRSLPVTSGRLGVPGLHHPVDVGRDASGIPQILADDPEDLFLAQGYVEAQDRFWQMDTERNIAEGRLAEMFGAGQVDDDKLVRTLGWYRVARQEADAASPRTRAFLQAFSAGVNAYLKDHTGARLSVEYAVLSLADGSYRPRPWTPVDSVVWLKAVAWQLNSTTSDQMIRAVLAAKFPVHDVDRIFPPYDFSRWDPVTGPATARSAPPSAARTTTAVPAAATGALTAVSDVRRRLTALLGPSGTGIGSNAWVVAGSRSATGAPLLANDPHLAPTLPGVWYQIGLHCRTVTAACPYDVTGFTFPGMPGVLIGHNQRIAWGFTALGAADSDLYLEKITGDDYTYQGRQLPLTTRRETIAVAGGSPVTFTVRATRHGPVISDADRTAARTGAVGRVPDAPRAAGGYAVALRWAGLVPSHTIDAVFAMDAATDWTGFRAAAALLVAPAQNMVYADVRGNIGYQMPGLLPIRARGDGSYPVPGWTGDHEWRGYVPFDRLPHELNPTRGYIVTANNAVTGPDYPYPITPYWGTGYRSRRIADLITGGGKLTVADMGRIEGDTLNPNARQLVPYLLKAPVAPGTAAAVDLLRGWDLTQPPDSAAAAYFNAVWSHLLDLVFTSRLRTAGDVETFGAGGGGRWFDVVRTMLGTPDDPWWSSPQQPALHGRDAVLGAALDAAARDLDKRLGGDPKHWRWGALHTLELRNQTLGTGAPAPVRWLLNRGPYQLGGGTDLVDATGWFPPDGYGVDWVPSMRMVVDLGRLDDSRWINLTGASGHTASPHYTDQTALWRAGRTLPWPSSPAAVRASVKEWLRLTPAR